MCVNEEHKIGLVSGSNPTKDKDAVGQYTEVLYEHVSSEIAERRGDKLRVELVHLRPKSPTEWWSNLTHVFERYDVVHIGYPFEGWGTSIAPGVLPAILKLFSRHRRTRVVTTFHEWRTMHPLRKASVLPLALFSDGLLFVSEQERSAYDAGLCRKLRRRQEMAVMPIGINVTLPELSSEEIIGERERLLNCKDAPVEVLLCCFGFIYAAKQPYKALRALKVLLDRGVRARLVFVGDFPADHLTQRRKFLQQVGSLGLENHVLLLGFLDDAVLARVISACDAALLLFSDGVSTRRGSFWTVLELGVPLITTRPASEREFRDILPEAFLEDLVFVGAKEEEERLADIISQFAQFRVPVRRSGISPDWRRIATDHVTFYQEMLDA